MRVDAKTFVEFGLRTNSGGLGPLAQLIDRCETRLGKAALGKLLGAPRTDTREIRALQDTARRLASDLEIFAIPDAAVESVEKYRSSRVVLSPHRGARARIEDALVRARYRDQYREIETGIDAVRELGSLLGATLDGLGRDGAHTEGALLRRLRFLVELEGRAELHRATLETDAWLRGEAADGLEDALAALGELDALRTIGLTHSMPGWSTPVVLDAGPPELAAEGLFHPLVPNAVANDIELSGDRTSLFLTGPNMAGKSTFIRSIGLSALLAQTGAAVPARSYRIRPFEAIHTNLNPADSVEEGVSLYLREVLTVRAAAESLANGDRSLVLFDEVFRSTNVLDATEATAITVNGLSQGPCVGIFSSHLHGVRDGLTSPRVACGKFEASAAGEDLTFDYELTEGVSEQRVGMRIMSRTGTAALLDDLAESSPLDRPS